MKRIASVLFSVLAAGCVSQQPQGVTLTELDGLPNTSAPSNKVSVAFQAFDPRTNMGVATLDTDSLEILEDGAVMSHEEGDHRVIRRPQAFHAYSMVLLDFSGSVLEDGKLDDVKTSADAFVTEIFADSHNAPLVGLYWFDGQDSLHQIRKFSADEADLRQAISSLTAESIQATPGYDRSTNLFGAIEQGVATLDTAVNADPAKIKVSSIVTFTDGRDRAKRTTLKDATTALDGTDFGLKSFTIGINSSDIVPAELQSLGKDGYVLADNLSQLTATFQNIANRVNANANSYYLLEYCSPSRSGDHVLTVSLKDSTATATPNAEQQASLKLTFSATGFRDMCVFTPDS